MKLSEVPTTFHTTSNGAQYIITFSVTQKVHVQRLKKNGLIVELKPVQGKWTKAFYDELYRCVHLKQRKNSKKSNTYDFF